MEPPFRPGAEGPSYALDRTDPREGGGVTRRATFPADAVPNRPDSSAIRRRRAASSGRKASSGARQAQLPSGSGRVVHARVAAEAEDVLQRDDRALRDGIVGGADQDPLDLAAVAAEVVPDALALLGLERGVPAARRVVVVRARVDDAVLAGTGAAGTGCRPRRSRTAGSSCRESRARRAAPARPSSMSPRSSARIGSGPSVRARGVEEPAARARAPSGRRGRSSPSPERTSRPRTRGSGRCAAGRRRRGRTGCARSTRRSPRPPARPSGRADCPRAGRSR